MESKNINIIHSASNVILSAYTYSAVYSTTSTTLNINGGSTTIPTGIIIPIDIVTIDSNSNVFCLGTKISNLSVPQIING